MTDIPEGVQVDDVEPEVGAHEAPHHSEQALALTLVARHVDELRFVAASGKWFIWDGRCWKEDQTRRVFSMSQLICREFASVYGRRSC